MAMKNPYKIGAKKICDISKFTDEEIFGKDSIRDHAVVDSKNPEAPGYQKYTITGSQAGVVLGLSHWQIPAELWAIKRGTMEPTDIDPELAASGHEGEPFVAQKFKRKLEEDFESVASVELYDDTTMYQHKKYPWMLADTDRFALITFKSGKTMLVGLECKICTNWPTIEKWKNGIVPPNYEAQCRHYMAVCDIDAWYIACSWGMTKDDTAVVLIRRDKDKENDLIETEKAFIECCEEGIEPQPPAENLELLAAFYNATYNGLKENTIEVEDNAENKDIFSLASSISALEEQKKALEKEISEKKAQVATFLIRNSQGNGTVFNYSENGIDYQSIYLKVPTSRDTVDIDKLKDENPNLLTQLAEIGMSKLTKTDISKLKVDGKKFDATPYIIPGQADISKPITLDKVTTWAKTN